MLHSISEKFNIILASGSPRRQQFFKDLNIPFSVQLFDVEEIYPDNLNREQITNYLAELKAVPFNEILRFNDLVITSDTIVWFDNKALGKPKTKEEALAILTSLSGNYHEVITSVSFKTQDKIHTLHNSTKVFFKTLTTDEIEYYIDIYKPYDKAGSYGIQEWIGYIGVEKIEGDYFNVMGLPVNKVYNYLKNLL